MTVAVGSRLGAYEITAKLGEGGMGEVYRATDSKLKREVAIKVLPAVFTADPERLARFEREAQLLAQLHHPNIASVFGLEESGGVRALVMELVEGEDLSARVAHGALPIDEALPIARQIAEALEAAHEKGIVHRDLKPANVKLRSHGTVKVLDFGLAKALDPAAAPLPAADLARSPTLMNSPTLTSAGIGTQLGVILGTAAYMAPEQARGGAVDKRADIWAFGVVLFEMLTGRRLFAGDGAPDILASVLRQEIDLSILPAGTPARVRRLLSRCLERDPRRRLRDIGEARLTLAGEFEPEADVPGVSPRPAAPRRRLAGVAAFVLVAAVAALAAWRAKPSPVAPTVRLSIALPPGEQVTGMPAISPDGQTIAYVAGRSAATSRLYLRGLDEYTPRAVHSGALAAWPCFSPDGTSVAFFAGGKLWRAPVTGGGAIQLARAPRAFGASWGEDGKIVFSPSLNGGLWSVPVDGGEPVQLTQPDSGVRGYAHVFPQHLPGGEILFTFWGKTFYSAVLSPTTGEWRQATVTAGRGLPAVFSSNGFLLRNDGTAHLAAAPWTPSTTRPVQLETPVLDDVYWVSGTDRSWFNVSRTGTAVFAAGDPTRRRAVWVNRGGEISELPGEPDEINLMLLSRAGERIVHNGSALWVRDLSNGARVRLLSDVSWVFPAGWLPGDERVVYSSNLSGDWDLYTQRAAGAEPEPLLRRPFTQHPMAVAPDGSVVFIDYAPSTGIDLWVLPHRADGSWGSPRPLVVSPFIEWQASVSPDGRTVTYVSDAAGRSDVYAVPFEGGDPVIVSVDGGTGPEWSRDGKEFFYRSGDQLISVDVTSTAPLTFGTRRKLFDLAQFEPQYFHEFQVAADGRFLFLRAEPGSRPTRLDVILNWFPELERKAAVK